MNGVIFLLTNCAIFSTVLTFKERLFKVITNRTFKDLNTIYSRVTVEYRFLCPVLCTLDNKCCSCTYNSHDKICMFNSCCKGDTVYLSGSDIFTTAYPVDCSEIPPGSSSGVYDIYPTVNGAVHKTEAYCDMENGRWTVMQRRTGTTVGFHRNFASYKGGFGDKSGDHWLGNELLHHMLSSWEYSLQIDLEDINGDTSFARYQSFYIGNEATKYTLFISGYNGTAGDALTDPYCDGGVSNSHHVLNGSKFSTTDDDNDGWPGGNCGDQTGWWMNWCACGNPNDLYWKAQRDKTIKSTIMKIKSNVC